MPRKVPVTVITGFLGSGKTTLIHHILNNPADKKIAVIVNEFGEAGIDGDVIQSGCGCEEENILELNNGCLCCTVQEEFLPTMQKLMERKEDIDHIIIETSGLALPKPLLQAVNWPDLKAHVTIDAVITVVDAVGMATGEICDREKVQEQRLADDSLDHETPIEELFEDQLGSADLVIVSKKDLVEEERYKEVENMLQKRIRENVKIIPAEQGKVPVEVMLGINASAESDLDNRRSKHEENHHHGDEDHDHEHEHDHDHHHDESINSHVLKISKPHDPDQLVEVLKGMVDEYEVYRIKGYIYVEGKPMRMVLQGVGDRFDRYFDRKWKEGEEKVTSLVVIGRHLDANALQSFVESRLKQPETT